MEFFSSFGGEDPLKPSIFELVAQEQLRDLLQPALKYVLAVFAQRYPRYLLRIVNRHEEFYGLLMLIVERYYLKKHNASFAENFYGLKRRRRPFIDSQRAQAAVGGIPPGEKLRNREVTRSLFFLVAIPYIRAKAQDYFEALGGGLDTDLMDDETSMSSGRMLSDESLSARLKKVFVKVYPWLNTGFEVWLLLYNVGYLFDRVPGYRPWLNWIGVDIRRLGIEDFRAANSGPPLPENPAVRRSVFEWLKAQVKASPKTLLDSLRLLLPTAIFFVKFLEWWYSPNSPARSLSVSPKGPMIPPPKMLRPHPRGIPFNRDKYGECPICRKEINNATALPSGYVFCYRCAYDEVEKNGRCPVTLLPAQVWQLRKILV